MAKEHVTAKSDRPSGRYEVIGPRGGAPNGKFVVREASSGRFMEVRGAGALKDAKFSIDKKIDLNKPIAKQALRASKSKKQAKG